MTKLHPQVTILKPDIFLAPRWHRLHVPDLIFLSKAEGGPRLTQNRMKNLSTPSTYRRLKWTLIVLPAQHPLS